MAKASCASAAVASPLRPANSSHCGDSTTPPQVATKQSEHRLGRKACQRHEGSAQASAAAASPPPLKNSCSSSGCSERHEGPATAQASASAEAALRPTPSPTSDRNNANSQAAGAVAASTPARAGGGRVTKATGGERGAGSGCGGVLPTRTRHACQRAATVHKPAPACALGGQRPERGSGGSAQEEEHGGQGRHPAAAAGQVVVGHEGCAGVGPAPGLARQRAGVWLRRSDGGVAGGGGSAVARRALELARGHRVDSKRRRKGVQRGQRPAEANLRPTAAGRVGVSRSGAALPTREPLDPGLARQSCCNCPRPKSPVARSASSTESAGTSTRCMRVPAAGGRRSTLRRDSRLTVTESANVLQLSLATLPFITCPDRCTRLYSDEGQWGFLVTRVFSVLCMCSNHSAVFIRS